MKTVELSKATLVYVPPQQEQYFRPFEVSGNGDDIANLIAMTDGTINLSAANMAPIASRIISPAAVPHGKVSIPNSLSEGRYAFFLEITTSTSITASKSREIITGFTNYAGISPTGSIDPEMVFHVNNRTVLHDSNTIAANGNQTTSVMRSDTQVLADQVGYHGLTGLRPQDVVGLNQVTEQTGDVTLSDSRNRISGSTALASAKGNVMPHIYLSKLCAGYMDAHSTSQFGEGVYGAQPYDQYTIPGEGGTSNGLHNDAFTAVKDSSMLTSDLMQTLGGLHPTDSHTFKMCDLDNVWPRPDGWWSVSMPGPSFNGLGISDTEHWRGSDKVTIIASCISQCIPALMSSLMLMGMEVNITNQTLTGEVAVSLVEVNPMFDNAFTAVHAQHLINQIQIHVVQAILDTRVASFDIGLRAYLVSSTEFRISVDGEPMVPYSAPMFCSSYYSPMIGMDVNALRAVTTGVGAVIDDMLDVRVAMQTQTGTLAMPTTY